MTRAGGRPAFYRVVRTVEEAYGVSRALSAELKRLSGRARLARAAELEELCRDLELHVQTLEQQMAAVRDDLRNGQHSAKVCIAYTNTQKRLW